MVSVGVGRPQMPRWSVGVDPDYRDQSGKRLLPPELNKMGLQDGILSGKLALPLARQLILWLENVSSEAVLISVPGHSVRFDWAQASTLNGSGRKRVADLGNGAFRIWVEPNGTVEITNPTIEAVNGVLRIHEARLKGVTTWVR